MRPLVFCIAKVEEGVKGVERSSLSLTASFGFTISYLRGFLQVLPAIGASCTYPSTHAGDYLKVGYYTESFIAEYDI